MRGSADVGLWVSVCFMEKISLHRPSCKTTFAPLTQSQAISQSFRVFITFRSMRDTTFFSFSNSFLGRAPASPTVMLRISNLSLAMYIYIYIYIDRRVVTFLWASPVWRQTSQAQKNGAQSFRTGPKWYTTCTSSRFFAKYTHFAIVFGGSAGEELCCSETVVEAFAWLLWEKSYDDLKSG